MSRLEKAVGRLVEELGSVRRRSGRVEDGYRALTEALRSSGPDGVEPDEVGERLRDLAEENERLRDLLAQARDRAERIRSRLMVVEDEL